MLTRHIPVDVARAMLLGLILIAAFFAWESHLGFSLWDEGYLWYGIQRVIAGEVPIRDFQAYDPGRYYWSALLMRPFGADGIVAVRGTLAILQGASLAAALGWLAATNTRHRSRAYILLCAAILIGWMAPRHKLFDISISIGLVLTLASLVHRPSLLKHFATGTFIGLAAYFGRNHGVYGIIATSGVMLYLALHCQDWSHWWRGVALLVAGTLVGYLPMIATMVFAQGFTSAFIDSVKFLFDVKATNLPLPIPWPWLAPFGNASPTDALRALIIGLCFVAILVFPGVSVCYVLWARATRRPCRPLLVACAFCSVPYAHYALSRADLPHLAQSIFPTLIGVLVLIMSMPTWTRLLTAGALCAISWFATAPMHPGLQCLNKDACEEIIVGSDKLHADHGAAQDVLLLRELEKRYAPTGQNFFVAPYMPGAYALFGARSPTWEIYTPWPRSDPFQQEEIRRIEASKPAFVLIYDYPLDGHDELRYRRTHPLIEQYVRSNYSRLDGLTSNPAYQIYRAKGS